MVSFKSLSLILLLGLGTFAQPGGISQIADGAEHHVADEAHDGGDSVGGESVDVSAEAAVADGADGSEARFAGDSVDGADGNLVQEPEDA